MQLPTNVTVQAAADHVRDALDEFDALEPTKYALAHWLAGVYRRALAMGGQEHVPFTLRVTSNVEVTIAEAQKALADAREAARTGHGFIERLPPRVNVVRVRDDTGALGFAPIDVRGATLAARVLSILLADYLMHPERYVDDERAA